jgi:hypothetical protein
MRSLSTALLAPFAVAILALATTPARAAALSYAQYTRIVEADVEISPVPGRESYIFALTYAGAPGPFDSGLQTVTRSYTDALVTASASSSVRQVVVPGSNGSVAAWSVGEVTQTTGGGCEESGGCNGAGAWNRVGSSWWLSFSVLEDIDYELTGSTEHARVLLSRTEPNFVLAPLFTLEDASGSTRGRFLAGRAYVLEAAALFSTFTGADDPYVCCSTITDRFAWSFDLKLTPVPLPGAGVLFLGALGVLGAVRARRAATA